MAAKKCSPLGDGENMFTGKEEVTAASLGSAPTVKSKARLCPVMRSGP
jgi:hypothetical protein